MPRQTWIADAARSVGLAVIEVDGWRERGKESFNPGGVVWHHTAGASTGEMPSLRVLINGRSDVPGPLCNWGLSRSGVVYIVAAGRSNNAGKGGWRGMVGNSSVLGIEAENDGRQPWPARQLDAYYELCAAAERHLRRGVEFQCGHKEWAPGRKVDPHSLGMDDFRAAIRAVLEHKEDDVFAMVTETGGHVYMPVSGETAVLLSADFKIGFVRVASGSADKGWDISTGDKTTVPAGRTVRVPIRAGAELVCLVHKGGQRVGARLVR